MVVGIVASLEGCQSPLAQSDDLFRKPGGHCNFYRRDDWSATSYFYLDRPESGLPPLPPAAQRTAGLE
jgi:hypothetical protein